MPKRPLVLLVDDVQENLDLLADILGDDYETLKSINGETAVHMAMHQHPDLILLDIMMPGMDGFEVCIELSKEDATSRIPVIFLTAKTNVDDIVRGLEMGAVDYITKPFNMLELLARVRTQIDLKRNREDLARAIRDKDKFFSIIAHDLRGPLGSFMSIADFVSNNLDSLDIEEIRPLMHEMHLTASSVYELLENLLDWSRIQLGKIRYNPEALEMSMAVEDAVHPLRSQAELKEITVTVDVAEDIKVQADRNMLASILRNLVSNAVKYTPRGGKVTISGKTDQQEGVLQVEIRDTGIGMSEEASARLFDITESRSKPGTENEKGSGLGLILCKELLQMHGQPISATSVEGKGTTIGFTLNLA